MDEIAVTRPGGAAKRSGHAAMMLSILVALLATLAGTEEAPEASRKVSDPVEDSWSDLETYHHKDHKKKQTPSSTGEHKAHMHHRKHHPPDDDLISGRGVVSAARKRSRSDLAENVDEEFPLFGTDMYGAKKVSGAKKVKSKKAKKQKAEDDTGDEAGTPVYDANNVKSKKAKTQKAEDDAGDEAKVEKKDKREKVNEEDERPSQKLRERGGDKDDDDKDLEEENEEDEAKSKAEKNKQAQKTESSSKSPKAKKDEPKKADKKSTELKKQDARTNEEEDEEEEQEEDEEEKHDGDDDDETPIVDHDLPNPKLPFGDMEPFGREATAQQLTEDSIMQSDAMVDQIEKAELAEEQRSVFRALTRLRGAALASFDGIARSATGNIQDYAAKSRWRKRHPVSHLAEEEGDVETWAFPTNAD